MNFKEVVSSVRRFEKEAAKLLANFDGAVAARAFNAHEALVEVNGLSIEQSDSLKQAVRCVEHNLYRAAFVMAWTAVADLLLVLAIKNEPEIKTARPKWKFEDKASLSDAFGDHAIVEALKEAKVISKGQMKSLHGLLHRRNQCAHPSDYFPSADEALGYIREAISFCRALHAKSSD
jgi:hypothetical protein